MRCKCFQLLLTGITIWIVYTTSQGRERKNSEQSTAAKAVVRIQYVCVVWIQVVDFVRGMGLGNRYVWVEGYMVRHLLAGDISLTV